MSNDENITDEESSIRYEMEFLDETNDSASVLPVVRTPAHRTTGC